MGADRPILVGVDGSNGSDRALAWSARFAARHRTAVEPVFAWDYPTFAHLPYPTTPMLPSELEMQTMSEHAMNVVLNRWRLTCPDSAVVGDTTVVHGDPGSELVGRATDASLLVVGSRGLSTKSRPVVGSVSSFVAAYASCPVVIVPTNMSGDNDVHSIVVGIDGSEHDDAALQWAIETFPGTSIDVVHFWSIPIAPGPMAAGIELGLYREMAEVRANETVDRIRDAAKATEVSVGATLVEGNPRFDLTTYASDADLLVLGTGDSHRGPQSSLGSVAHASIAHLTGPTVVVRPMSPPDSSAPEITAP